MKKYNKLVVALAALLVLTTGSVASAQTATTTTDTGTTVTTPGTPNTGTGGNAAVNWMLLGASGLVLLGGASYLGRKPQHSLK